MPSPRPSEFAFSASGKLRLYNTEELLKLPPPEWLVKDTIPKGALVGLYGPPGCGKSFLAIDLSLAVASGRPWHGLEAQRGFVVYVSAEGTAGLGMRVRAWLLSHEVDMSTVDVAWVTEAVPLYAESEDLDVLFERFDEVGREPDLVIIDTLARCFEGDENQQQDMGRFVTGVDRLRHSCGATVVVVHHTNVDASRERGSTALRGAADTMLRVVPGILGAHNGKFPLRQPQGTFTMVCDKQKDAECSALGVGSLVPVEGTRSCAVELTWVKEQDLTT